jgi:hypothetical protein
LTVGEENLSTLAELNVPHSAAAQDLSTIAAENQPDIPQTPASSVSQAAHSTPLIPDSSSLICHASPIQYDDTESSAQDLTCTTSTEVDLSALTQGKQDVGDDTLMHLVRENAGEDVMRRIDDMLQNVGGMSPSVLQEPVAEKKASLANDDILNDLLATAAKPKVLTEEEKEAESSVLEFTVDDESFSVDEKFVTSRKKSSREEAKEDAATLSSPSSSSVNALDSALVTTTDSADRLDDDSHSAEHLLTTEDSISIDNMLDANLSHEEDLSELQELNAINARMNNGYTDSPTLSVTDADASQNVTMHSAQTSVGDSSYYTPNASSSEKKDDQSSLLSVNRSQANDSVSECSDQRSVSSWRTDSSQCASPIYSPNRLTDAKRRFFFEAAQPVRIDPKNVFKDFDKKRAVIAKEISEKEFSEPKKLDLKTPEWKSVDSATAAPTTPTAGVPRSNSANGDNDPLYKPSTSMKTEKTAPEKRRQLPSVPTKTNVDITKKVLTAEEIKMIKEVEKTKGRTSTREKVFSDGEQGSTRKGLLKKKESRPLSEKTKKKNEGGFRPFSSRGAAQNSSHSDSSTLSSTESPSMPARMKGEDKKVQLRKEDKENKAGMTTGEKKRRSLLAILLPSKSQERKDKGPKSPSSAETRAKSPPLFGRSTSKDSKTPQPKDSKAKDTPTATPETRKPAPTASKKLDVKLRPKSGRSLSAEESGKRGSMIDEVAPLLKDEKYKMRESMKERIQAVAPPHVIQKSTIAPHAEIDEFENESEFGDDKISLRSFKLEQQGLSEEEVARLLKKQQRAAQRRQREQEMKRLRMAQEIQRQLQEVEQRQKEVETRGVSIERGLRGEESPGMLLIPSFNLIYSFLYRSYFSVTAAAPTDETHLMQEWFNVVHEKNVLVRYESELMVQ